jgi:hypothetical protein
MVALLRHEATASRGGAGSPGDEGGLGTLVVDTYTVTINSSDLTLIVAGERGPQGDHGQDGHVGEPGRTGRTGVPGARGAAGADAIMLDRLPLVVLVLVLAAVLGFLLWRDHQLADALERTNVRVAQLEQQVTVLQTPPTRIPFK